LVPRQTAAQGKVSRVWSYWLVPADEIDGSNSLGVLADFKITLCYTAFDTARLDVKLYGDLIYTEPLPQLQPSLDSYTFNDIIIQLGTMTLKFGSRQSGHPADGGARLMDPGD
jgi:hypothetical protein